MDNGHREASTEMVEATEVPLDVHDQSDPCCLHAIEQAEEQDSIKEVRTAGDAMSNHETSEYDLMPPGEGDRTAERRRIWKGLAISSCFTLIILEGIFGYLSGSVACLTATVHMISDYLGEHSSTRYRSNTFRRAECIFILLCVVVLLAANSAFMVVAVGRLYVKKFTINETYMLIAAILALTANCIMLTMHFAKVFRPRRFLALGDFIGVRVQQIAHAVGNHGTSLVLFAAAIILYVQRDWIIVDSIATFVLTVAILSNAASVTTKYYIELRRIGTRRDTYQVI